MVTSIDEEIKQSNFKSERQRALINVIYTHNHIVNKMNDFFKGIDITRQQYNVLRILRGQHPKPASVNLIKERLLDKMSDVSRMVKRLENKGLVTRQKSEKDKRSSHIKISKSGLDLLSETDSDMNDFEDIFNNLTDRETSSLNYLLDKLRE